MRAFVRVVKRALSDALRKATLDIERIDGRLAGHERALRHLTGVVLRRRYPHVAVAPPDAFFPHSRRMMRGLSPQAQWNLIRHLPLVEV